MFSPLLALLFALPALAADADDDDGDGLGEAAGDCDDTDRTVYPGAPEQCNGKDDDCDEIVDEGTLCSDDDGDGWTEDAGDCDDNNRSAYPTAVEEADGEDDDCDGIVDEGTAAYDDDNDGYAEQDGDCDDADRARNPSEDDLCRDGLDQDCTGQADDRCVESPTDGCDPSLSVGLTAPSASPVAGDTVDLQGSVFTDDRALVPTLTWQASDGTLEVDAADASRARWTLPAAAGEASVTLYGADPCGYGGGATVRFTVLAAPEAEDGTPASEGGCGKSSAALLLLPGLFFGRARRRRA